MCSNLKREFQELFLIGSNFLEKYVGLWKRRMIALRGSPTSARFKYHFGHKLSYTINFYINYTLEPAKVSKLPSYSSRDHPCSTEWPQNSPKFPKCLEFRTISNERPAPEILSEHLAGRRRVFHSPILQTRPYSALRNPFPLLLPSDSLVSRILSLT